MPHLASREMEGKVNAGPEDTPLAEVPSLSLYHLSLWSFGPYGPSLCFNNKINKIIK